MRWIACTSVRRPNMPNDMIEIARMDAQAPRKRTMIQTSPMPWASVSEPVGDTSPGDDETGLPTSPCYASSHVATISQQLTAAQRKRRFCIRQRLRADRAIESLIAPIMGFNIDLSEKDRKSIFARAKTYRLFVEKGGEGHSAADIQILPALSAVRNIILASAENRGMWDRLLAKTEKDMAAQAKMLPAYAWVKTGTRIR